MGAKTYTFPHALGREEAIKRAAPMAENLAKKYMMKVTSTDTGFEMAGKRQFDGLKLAFGQQIWWGANPAVIAKYRKVVGRYTTTAIYQEDVATQSAATNSSALPTAKTRKATYVVENQRGPLGIELGGIWSGSRMFPLTSSL